MSGKKEVAKDLMRNYIEDDIDPAMQEQVEAELDILQQAHNSAMAMTQQMMDMQQQMFSGGAIDPQMILQMQQQAMEATGYAEFFGESEEDEQEEKAKAEFIAAHPQPEGMSKYLAFGSFFTVMRDEPLETLEMMGDVEDYVEEMESSWGIDDRKSLTKMLESLIGGRHYKQTNDTYLAIKSGKLDDVADEDAEEYQSALEALRELGLTMKEINSCPSVLAWDLERAAYLIRTGTHAEYVTKEEAWDYLKRIAVLAKAEFSDWTQYGISIVMGRVLHMGFHEMYIHAMHDLLLADPEFLTERPLTSF